MVGICFWIYHFYLLVGLVVTEKWNTEGVLGTIIEVNNQFARGLKTTLEHSYAPNNGKRDALFKAEWTNENVKVIPI